MKRANPSEAASSSEIQRKVVTLLQRQDCDEALRVLGSGVAGGSSVRLVVLDADAYAICYFKHGEDPFKRRALSAVEAGLKRFPRSSLLLAEKGILLAIFGDHSGGKFFLARAQVVAKENIRDDKTGTVAEGETRLLGRIERLLGKLEEETTPATATQELLRLFGV